MAPTTPAPSSREPQLSAYIADLELEVDRLRKQTSFLGQSALDAIDAVIPLCAARDEAALPQIEEINRQLASLLHDALEPPDHHPRDDQVAALALRR